MAGWTISVNSFGNSRATFNDKIKGVKVTAYLEDIDGDGVEWNVFDDNVLIASGAVHSKDGPLNGTHISDEDWAWQTAQRNAEHYITASNALILEQDYLNEMG